MHNVPEFTKLWFRYTGEGDADEKVAAYNARKKVMAENDARMATYGQAMKAYSAADRSQQKGESMPQPQMHRLEVDEVQCRRMPEALPASRIRDGRIPEPRYVRDKNRKEEARRTGSPMP
jgi:hypothetical protein